MNSSFRHSIVGWKTASDRWRFAAALVSCGVIYTAVLYSESREKQRRHASIQKDITRETWRRKQLGIDEGADDDGFAECYIDGLKRSGEYDRNIKAFGTGLIPTIEKRL